MQRKESLRSTAMVLLAVIMVAGALAAVVAIMTVQWLYPRQPAAQVDKEPKTPPSRAASPQTQSAPLQAASPQTQATPPQAQVTSSQAPPSQKSAANAQPATTPPATATATSPPTASANDEQVALDLIRRAGSGDVTGALTLTTSLTAELLTERITRMAAAPLRAARLPGPTPRVLVWADYTRELTRARGAYEVALSGGKVRDVKGPLAPEGGYGKLPFEILDEGAAKVDMTPLRGRGILLISPRLPEAGLAETLTNLSATFGPQGVTVALVLDMRSPDWASAARQAGFTGPVWRIKGRLEDVPLVVRSQLLGGYGILVDRDGYAVASLAALDPGRYDLPEQKVEAIAPTVLKAYNLLP